MTSLWVLVGSTNMGVCNDSDDEIELGRRGAIQRYPFANQADELEGLITTGNVREQSANARGQSTVTDVRRFYIKPFIVAAIGLGLAVYGMYTEFEGQRSAHDSLEQLKLHKDDWNARCVTFPCNNITNDNSNMNSLITSCFN